MSLPENENSGPVFAESAFAEPTFAEPWQATAFALTHALADAGAFTWNEWTEALAGQTGSPDAATDGRDYYSLWLRALETLLARKKLAMPDLIDQTQAAWQSNAIATPHGQPIPSPDIGKL